jgi:DNA-binding MarR family transcriptional regulator
MSRGGESLFVLLVRAHTVAQRLAADLLLECGVSVLEAWLLEEIPVTGDLCATEIARALGVPTSTVTRALRRLESYGYITLVKGTFLDTRVLRPALTEYGIAIRKHVSGFEHDLDRMLLAELRPLELGAFVMALTRIINCPTAVADQPAPPDPPPGDLGYLTYESFVPRRPAPTTHADVLPTAEADGIDPLSLF